MRKALPIVILLAGFCSGCGDSSTSEPTTPLIPINSGNQWVYKSVFLSGTGDTLNVFYDTAFIGLSTVLKNNTYYFFNNLPLPRKFENIISLSGIHLVRIDGRGVWLFNETTQKEELTLPYPVSPGSIHIVSLDSSVLPKGPIVKEKMVVVSTSESIAIAERIFTCYHYYLTIEVEDDFKKDIYEIGDYYIAPSVGIVKIRLSENTVFNQGPEWTRMLHSYILK